MTENPFRPLVRLQTELLEQKNAAITRMVQDIAVLRGWTVNETWIYYEGKPRD